MAQLSISGTVQYQPGPWGVAIPAPGVSIEIIENHVFPSSTEVIWSGQTDANGRFSGTTREWRRTVTVGVGPARRTVPDETDILSLTARVRDYQSGSREATLPFVHIPNLPSPPVILPWSPPLLGRVNGASCWHPGEFAAKCLAAVQAKTPLRIEVFGSGPDFERMQRIIEPFLDSFLQSFGRAARHRLPLGAGRDKLNTLKDDKKSMAQSGQKSLQSHLSGAYNQGGTVVEGAPDIVLAIIRALVAAGIVTVGISVAITVITVEIITAAISALVAIIAAVAMVVPATVVMAVTVVMSIPQLLRALSLLMRSLGFADAADELDSMASSVAAFTSQSWFQYTTLAILMVCAIVMLVTLQICQAEAAQASLVAGQARAELVRIEMKCESIVREFYRLAERERKGFALLLGS